MGISVEDVQAYVNFIKETVGITQDSELVRIIEILAHKAHPLALGNVDRFLSQSRMMARKILNTHMNGVSERDIDEIIENMASKLYFHGHPINRREARNELRLKVADAPSLELEGLMWSLYKDYEAEFDNRTPFLPYGDLVAIPPAPGPAAPAPMPHPMMPGMGGPMTPPVSQEYDLPLALIESGGISSRQTVKKRFTLHRPQPGQAGIQEETLGLAWSHTPAP